MVGSHHPSFDLALRTNEDTVRGLQALSAADAEGLTELLTCVVTTYIRGRACARVPPGVEIAERMSDDGLPTGDAQEWGP